MTVLNAPRKTEVTIRDIQQRNNVLYATQIFEYDAWFEYSTATKILNILDTMYLEAKQSYSNKKDGEQVNEVRSLGLLLFGKINSGKTTLCIRFQNRTKLLEINNGEIWSDYNIVYYEIDCRMSLKSFLSILLEKVGGLRVSNRALQNINTTTLIESITHELSVREIKILIIDEIQDLLSSHESEIQDIFIALKKIVNKSYTRVVLVGTPKAYDVLRKADETTTVSNPWVDERFRVTELKLTNEEFADLLFSLQNAYQNVLISWMPYNQTTGKWRSIIVDSKKTMPEINYLFDLCEGKAGKLIQLIKYSAINALLDNRTDIQLSDYEDVFNYNYSLGSGQIARNKK